MTPPSYLATLAKALILFKLAYDFKRANAPPKVALHEEISKSSPVNVPDLI